MAPLLKVFLKRACSLAFYKLVYPICVSNCISVGNGLNCVARFILILLHYDIHVRLRTDGSIVSS